MKKLAILHTGGTFAMESSENGALKPGNYAFNYIEKSIISRYNIEFEQFQLFNLDSSLFRTTHWVEIAEKISDLYDYFDSFIIIHGTDTMAFTASALSFFLKRLDKPVIITGSQLPLKNRRSDAMQNLIEAIEVATFSDIQEVVVLFNHKVFRGNRVKKKDAWDFSAFYSPNFPPLIKLGIEMEKNEHLWSKTSKGVFEIDTRLNDKVIIIPFYPGINFEHFNPMLENNTVDGIVIEAYGSGNIPSDNPGLEILFQTAADNKIPIAVCSQSPVGKVNLKLYEVASKLSFYGLVSAVDMTREATLVKMMIALGRYKSLNKRKKFMVSDIAGEKEHEDVRK